MRWRRSLAKIHYSSLFAHETWYFRPCTWNDMICYFVKCNICRLCIENFIYYLGPILFLNTPFLDIIFIHRQEFIMEKGWRVHTLDFPTSKFRVNSNMTCPSYHYASFKYKVEALYLYNHPPKPNMNHIWSQKIWLVHQILQLLPKTNDT